MNNNDISYLMNMLGKMDKNQLANGLYRMNQILTPEEKQKIIRILNTKNNGQG